MQIINSEWKILHMADPEQIIRELRLIGQVCRTGGSQLLNYDYGPDAIEQSERFVRVRIKQGHESIIEHFNITVQFRCDRKTSHQLVRHRLASYTQESTRHCNYKEGIVFIRPPYWGDKTVQYCIWLDSMELAETSYKALIKSGCPPEEAALVLPNSTATTIVVTANLREWRHIFQLRCNKSADLGIRSLMVTLRNHLKQLLPAVFGDL